MTTEKRAMHTPWKAILRLEARMEDGKPKLRPDRYRLLVRLILTADREGLVQISQRDLAEESGVEKTRVTRGLEALQEAGLIEKLRNGNKQIRPAKYRITL